MDTSKFELGNCAGNTADIGATTDAARGVATSREIDRVMEVLPAIIVHQRLGRRTGPRDAGRLSWTLFGGKPEGIANQRHRVIPACRDRRHASHAAWYRCLTVIHIIMGYEIV